MEEHPNPDLIRAYDRMVEMGWLACYAHSKAGIVAEYTDLGVRRMGELWRLLVEIAGGTDFQGFEQIFGRGFLIAVLLQFDQIPPARGGDGS